MTASGPRTTPLFPLEDLSHLPNDWLEAFLVLIDEDGDRDPDTRFIDSMRAIYRMREIEGREERDLHADHRNARAEKFRREGKPVPVERDQLYERDGDVLRVGRVSAKGGWAELHRGDSPGKRNRLPLPEGFRLIGWAR